MHFTKEIAPYGRPCQWLGEDIGDTASVENPDAIEEIAQAKEERQEGKNCFHRKGARNAKGEGRYAGPSP